MPDLPSDWNTGDTLTDTAFNLHASRINEHDASIVALEGATSTGWTASTVHAATPKTTPVDADEFALVDSAASFGLKRLTWANVKTVLNAALNFVVSNGALGTPSSGTLTNCTGLPVSGITASTSAALGVGSINLGHASDTTITRSGAGVVAIEGVELPTATTTQTFTNKRITPRTGSILSSATPTINTDAVDMYGLTALTVDITSFTTNLLGTPTPGQQLWIYVIGTATRAITWGASFENGASFLPTTTSGTTRLDIALVWNEVSSKWRCMDVSAALPRVTTTTSSATPTINTDNYDALSITALAVAITSMTTNLSGTPVNFQQLTIRIKDNGSARAITWGASFESGSVSLPSTTVAGKTLMVRLMYDSVDAKWACEASGSRA